MLRPLAGGCESVAVRGATVRQVVEGLGELYPALTNRLVKEGRLRGNISVAIDGEVSTLGLLDRVEPDSEIHFIPAIQGGRRTDHANQLG